VIAVCAFLPWCQLKRGHVAVDMVVQALPYRCQGAFGLVGRYPDRHGRLRDGLAALGGFGEKFPHGSDALRDALGMGTRPFFPETTYELEMPVWIPYGLAFIGAVLFFITSLYTVWRSLNWTPGMEQPPMTGLELALAGLCLMLVAIFLRVPIGVAMAVTGFVGTWIVLGRPIRRAQPAEDADLRHVQGLQPVDRAAVPADGAVRHEVRHVERLFQAASDWLGHRKGGVAMAAVGACAGFGAICGSSLATASTMGQVALPEMRKRGYSDALATGCLAAGGTLGILIPPSIILVIYAILAEQNIVKMFVAAIVPGILAALGYMLAVAVYVRVRPNAATTAERVPYGERFRTLARVWPVVVIFGLVMGGIAADWDWTQERGAGAVHADRGRGGGRGRHGALRHLHRRL
jgi:hypothetical protein